MALVRSCRENFLFRFFRIHAYSCHPASHEGRFAIVTNVECGLRWGASDCSVTDLMPTNNPDAHGQAVWSWRPGADARATRQRCRDAMMLRITRRRGQESRSPGRARSSRSNHRAGKAGAIRLSLWFLPRALLHARGPRVSVDARPSLLPLLSRGANADAKPGRDTPREGLVVCLRHREQQSDEAIQSRRMVLDCFARNDDEVSKLLSRRPIQCMASQPHSANTASTKPCGSSQNSRIALK